MLKVLRWPLTREGPHFLFVWHLGKVVPGVESVWGWLAVFQSFLICVHKPCFSFLLNNEFHVEFLFNHLTRVYLSVTL